MGDWSADDEDRFQDEMDELDEEREQNRRALSDDFAAFDASRYVRDVRGRAAQQISTPQPDAEPEERDPTAAWDDPLARLPARTRRTARTSSAQRRNIRRTSTQRRARSTAERAAVPERDPSLLGALFGSGLAPGLRFIVIAYGCFGLMLIVGLCGTFAWLFGLTR
ncbi:MAG: hypothetical protein CUN49_13755 [Candidatus Thermofonsia Clade 1 bacterium]|uniref:Uncharacterized protein n=1 Tax=Candidatus Thermofonsia Clade 1 bacterium TaxID=2364210 RepID=A0A2M8PB80_9CHLR|nr:MAG: hypothetical protein CUN49_13755 [Candidatus Thermofonsia Clade 1 bacterium]PJF42926.1 MAG: hypothetical protein CUN50_02060 [Candidatus Thermofonsia Clade 1 bacterium]